MARYLGRIETDRPAAEVFDYIADFTSVERWDETAVRTERVGSGAPGLGARFRVTVRFAGRETELEYETIAFERPERLLLRAESPAVVSLDEVTVAAEGGKTVLTYDARLEPKGALRLAGPILALLFRRLGDNAAAGLARELGGRVLTEG